MKKVLILTTLITVFTLTALPVLATAAVDQFGLDYGAATGLGTRDIREGIMTIVKYLLTFLGVIAILVMLYGGFVWLTSAGNEEKVGQAKKIITAGIIGLVIIFISYALARFVIEQLVLATGAAPV